MYLSRRAQVAGLLTSAKASYVSFSLLLENPTGKFLILYRVKIHFHETYVTISDVRYIVLTASFVVMSLSQLSVDGYTEMLTTLHSSASRPKNLASATVAMASA